MRSVWTGGCRGVILGVAVNQLLNLLASYCLRLGYYAPCLVSWPERFGGELNAALAQTAALVAIFGCAGAWLRAGRSLRK